jgi:tripartite-type tricarboxylate transporter receptor subunit TctC
VNIYPVVCVAGALALASGGVLAQSAWPAKPVRIIVPFAPGGPTDVQSRFAAARLATVLGQPVLVENRAGAGGVIGTDAVAKSPPDGYTLLGGNPGPLTIAATLNAKLPYDPLRDFAPIILLATAASALCVHPSVPAKTVPELIALARAKPGRINYGSPGVGTVGHLVSELLNFMGGVQMTHIPFKGAAQTVVDLMAGHIDVAFVQIAQAAPLVREGKLRAIGVSKLERSPFLPEVPTIHEQGLKGFVSVNWTGLLAPAGTPRDIVHRIHAELAKHLKSPEGQALAQAGFDVAGLGPDEYAAFLRAETERWAKVIRVAGIKAE